MIFAETTTGTFGTTEAAATTIKLPAGATILKIWAFSLTGTGVVYQLRFAWPGMTTPQTYLLPVLNALVGTAVGGGQNMGKYLDVEMHIAKTVDVTIYGLATVAAQSAVVGIIYKA